MECFKIENFEFFYPNEKKPAIKNISINIKEGEFIVVCGKSGCGKTTLLRHLKPVLAPHGTKNGSVFFQNEEISENDMAQLYDKIGFCFQNPDEQIVCDTVWHELSFGLENMGLNQEEIRIRVSEMAAFFGISNWFYKKTNELSGGQKQLLNLASIMLMQPKVLILDEPTAQLDPIAAKDFFEILKRINQELGITVILSEHRLEEVFSICDRVMVMDNGEIVAFDKPEIIGKILYDKNHEMFYQMPTAVKMYYMCGFCDNAPLTVKEAKEMFCEYIKTKKIESKEDLCQKKVKKEVILELKEVSFKYNKEDDDVLNCMSLKIYNGEQFCLVGGNGTGKTTLLSILAGINKPYRGKVLINNKDLYKKGHTNNNLVLMLPQNPKTLFIEKTVYLDYLGILNQTDKTYKEKEARINEIAKLLEIEHLLVRHPFDLSGGELQKCAIGAILLNNPDIILLDEPTKGLDSKFKSYFSKVLKNLKKIGKTVIMVSHDIEFIAENADRCAMLFCGDVVGIDNTKNFFQNKYFYTTKTNLITRGKIENVVRFSDFQNLINTKEKKYED